MNDLVRLARQEANYIERHGDEWTASYKLLRDLANEIERLQTRLSYIEGRIDYGFKYGCFDFSAVRE